MPDMDGIELVDTLKRNGLRIPTIFITAFTTVRIRERVQAGATLCMIEKPIEHTGAGKAVRPRARIRMTTGARR
jgi:FixJ family two-component response regulator